MTIQINSARIEKELDQLSFFSSTRPPAITRIVFDEYDIAARGWLIGQCVGAGLAVSRDPVGNTFFRWQGTDQSLSPVGTGSHIDAIPSSGRFDGTVGVLGGLEAIRALRESGFEPRRSIELVLFTSEEPTRFGYGCLGSRMLCGALSAERAAALKDRDGRTLDDLRREAGFEGALESVMLSPGHYSAFVELHIEQGPLLEAHQLDIGMVTNIAAPAAIRVTLEGSGGHAGAVLMRDRKDAFVGAAQLAVAVEAVALATGSPDSVATTGICDVFPGAVNSVPSRTKLEIDVRDTDFERRERMITAITEECRTIAARRGLQATIELLNSDAPGTCDEAILEHIGKACDELGLKATRMVSRAYHDSLFMSRIAPTAMIFIPCYKGYSHRPDEFASIAHIANGAAVLARTLAALSA